MGLGADASGASLTFTRPSASVPQSLVMRPSSVAPGLTLWGNGAISGIATGYLVMRGFDETGSSSPHFSGCPIETRLVSAVSFGVSGSYSIGAPPFAGRSANTSMRITGYLSANTAGTTNFQLTLQGQARVWIANQPVFDKWAVGSSTTTSTASIALPNAPVPIMVEFAGGLSGGQIGLLMQVSGSYQTLASGATLSYDMYETPSTQFGTSQFNNGLIAKSLSNNGNGLNIPEVTSFGGNALTNVSTISNSGTGITISENVSFRGFALSGVNSITNNGNGVVSSDPWVFNGLLTSGSIVSFGAPPSNSSCLLSLYGPSTLSRSTTAFYGFGLGTNTLAYRVPSTSVDHVFYAATTELARITGSGNLVVAGSTTFGGGIITPSVNNNSQGVTSSEAWTFTKSIATPRINNGGSGISTSEAWSFTGNVAFGSSHTPAFPIDCGGTAFINALQTTNISNNGNGVTFSDNASFGSYTITSGPLSASGTIQGPSIVSSGTLNVAGTSTFANNVGIGTGTPSFPLDLTNTSTTSGACMARFGSNTFGVSFTQNFPQVCLNNYYNGSNSIAMQTGWCSLTDLNPSTGFVTVKTSTGSVNGGSSASFNSAIVIDPSGKIGVFKTPANALDVAGGGSFSGSVAANGLASTGTLTVSGATTLAGLLTLQAGASVTGAVTASGQVQGGSVVSTGTLAVSGTSTLTGLATLQNGASVTGAMTASGQVQGGSLISTGTLTASGATTLQSTLTVNAGATVTGAASLSSTLTVQGTTTLNNTARVTGNVVVTGGAAAGVGPRLQTFAGGSSGATTGLDLSTYQGSSPPCFSFTATDLGNSTDALDILQYPGTGSTQINRLRIAGNGNIGLGGQLSPAYVLDVTGTGNFSGNLTCGTLNSSSLSLSGTLSVASTSMLAGASCTTLSASGNVSVGGTLSIIGATTFSSTVSVTGGTTLAGTTCTTLTASGAANLNTISTGAITCTGIQNFNNQIQNQMVCLFTSDASPVSTSTNYYGFGINGGILRYNVPSTSNHVWYVSTAEIARINTIGFGVLKTPTCPLDVNGTIQGTALISTGGLTAAGASALKGNVTVGGTTSPVSNLLVQVSSTGTGLVGIDSANSFGACMGVTGASSGTGQVGWCVGAGFGGTYTPSSARMVLNTSSQLGINTINPAYNCDISGTLRATGAGIISGGLTTTTISQTGSHVIGPSGAGGLAGPRLQLFGPGSAGATTGIDISGYGGLVWSITATDNGTSSAALDIYAVPSFGVAATNRMHFNAANNYIGLGGQTNPQSNLDVLGGIRQSIQVHGHWMLASSPNIPSNTPTTIPGSNWSLSGGTFVNASASAVLTSNGPIVFPFKGVWSITLQATFNTSATNYSNAVFYIVNTYSASGVSGNTAASNRLATSGGYGLINAVCSHTGLFNAGDSITPTAYSNANTNSLATGGNSTITITLINLLN